MDDIISTLFRKQTTLMAKVNNTKSSLLDKKLNEQLANIQKQGAELLQAKISEVTHPTYLLEKQKILDAVAQRKGKPPTRARIDQFEYLKNMSEAELQVVLLTLLPVIKVEDEESIMKKFSDQDNRCKYMIGT